MDKNILDISKEELVNMLMENLRIEVTHPQHDVGYYNTRYEDDEHNIKVRVFFWRYPYLRGV